MILLSTYVKIKAGSVYASFAMIRVTTNKMATEIQIVAENILRTRERLNKILAENTGKPIEEIARDTERDNFMTAEEALEYGIIDKVLDKRD